MRSLARSFVLVVALLAAATAGADVPIPPVARVTDLTGTLAAANQQALRDELEAFEKRKGSQVALLVLPTTQPETIEQYAIRVVDQWKLGRKGVDDGVLFVVARDDRALRIEVGYGLEGVLNDATAKRIIDEIVVPRFRAGDFAGGIGAGIDRVLAVIDGEPLPPPARMPVHRDRASDVTSLLALGLVLVVLADGVLRHFIGKVPAATVVSAAAGAIAWLVVGSLLIGVVVAIVAFAFSLASGAMPAGRGPRIGYSGYGGFGGGGGGGGGGWSGGGGGFGGGGASGRW